MASVMEAMMCARPTISTDVGGVAEMVGDAGLVVPPRDPVAFGNACLRLLCDRGLRSDLTRRGRDRALELFTLNRCLDAYRQRYGSLAAVT